MCEAEVDGWKGFLDVAATSGVESTASSSTQSRRIQISASPQHVKNNILQLYLIEVDVFFKFFRCVAGVNQAHVTRVFSVEYCVFSSSLRAGKLMQKGPSRMDKPWKNTRLK